MEEKIVIKYTGDKDVLYECKGFFSLELCKEWFYSKDKNCYGIPIKFEYLDGTGDADIDIRINDSNNDLSVFIPEYQGCYYNEVIWISKSFKDSFAILDAKINIAVNNYKLIIDFSDADLSETIDFSCNMVRERNCFSNMELSELWKMRKEAIVLDGISLDMILKNRLGLEGYVSDGDEDYFSNRYCCSDFECIYYIWCSIHVGSYSQIDHFEPGEQAGLESRMNGLKIRAVFNHQSFAETGKVMNTLYVAPTDNEHSDSTLICRYDYIPIFSDEIIWDNDLKSILIDLQADEIYDALKEQYIDIPVTYHNSRILLRIVLNPNWKTFFLEF